MFTFFTYLGIFADRRKKREQSNLDRDKKWCSHLFFLTYTRTHAQTIYTCKCSPTHKHVLNTYVYMHTYILCNHTHTKKHTCVHKCLFPFLFITIEPVEIKTIPQYKYHFQSHQDPGKFADCIMYRELTDEETNTTTSQKTSVNS